MPRQIEFTAHPSRTDEVVSRLEEVPGIVGIAVDRGAGVRPFADIIRVNTTNRGARQVLSTFADPDAWGITSISSSAPISLVSPDHQGELDDESAEAGWVDVAGRVREESDAEPNLLVLMFLAGGIAAVGLGTDALPIVIGAMIIAPGFEPFIRIPVVLIAGPVRSLKQAVGALAAGYVLMAAGAAVTHLVLQAADAVPPLGEQQWVRYWMYPSTATVVVAVLAGLAGALTVAAHRSVFAAGAMVALAVVPGMTLVGMGIAAGDWPIAGRGLWQWTLNGLIVMAAAAVVIRVKRVTMHGRARTP